MISEKRLRAAVFLLNHKRDEKMVKILLGLVGLLFLLSSCAMILQPQTSFDRRLKASAYGKILNQTNPGCDNCTDRFFVKKTDGSTCMVVVGYDGTVEVLE